MSEPTARGESPRHPRHNPATVAPALRERVYATLTGLAIVMTLLPNASQTSPGSAVATLAVTMSGLWAASVVADVVSHTQAHGDTPGESQWRHIGFVAAQAVEIAVVPVLAVALAGTGVWTLRTGLIIAAVALVLTQGVVALWAVRRSTVSPGKRLLIIIGELVLGGLVVAIKLLAH